MPVRTAGGAEPRAPFGDRRVRGLLYRVRGVLVPVRDLLVEIHYRAWVAAAVAGAVAAACASLQMAFPATAAAMAAGAILMWISEEEKRVLAAMADADAAALPPALAPSAPAPAAPVPANDWAAPVRAWANPFPSPRALRAAGRLGRRARR